MSHKFVVLLPLFPHVYVVFRTRRYCNISFKNIKINATVLQLFIIRRNGAVRFDEVFLFTVSLERPRGKNFVVLIWGF